MNTKQIEILEDQASLYASRQTTDLDEWEFIFRKKFAELIVKECADLVKARLNHIPDNQDDWDGHNYGETAAVYGILDAFQEHFGVDCDPENSKFGVEE